MGTSKGYPSSRLASNSSGIHATVEPMSPEQNGLSVRAVTGAYNAGNDTAETGSTNEVIKATGHPARVGDVVRFSSGAASPFESKVVGTTANTIQLADLLPAAPANGDVFIILRPRQSQVDVDGNLIVSTTAGPVQFVKDAVNVTVDQDTVTPANSRPLPTANYDSTGAPVNLALKAQLPATIGGKSKALSLGVGLSTEDAQYLIDQQTLTGLLNDTAPASDTASASLNGRLQRVAQNITAANVLAGPVTETAPATDTASSGLNGRLQRIAQRLTSLIALLPASIGQKNMAGSLAVTLANDQSAIPVTTSVSDVTASGTITTQNLVPAGAATAGSALASGALNGAGTATIQVTGVYTGALSLQYTVDGTNWITVGGTPFLNVNTGTWLASITSALQSIFQIEVTGLPQFRITALAAVTGTATVSIRISRASAVMALSASLPTGSAIIGALVANQSMNTAQINGVAPLMGNGVTGTGSLRVTVASDNTAIPVGQTAPTAVTVKQAAVTVGTTAVRATTDGAAVTAGRRRLSFRPDPTSAAGFWYGSSTVTSSGATRGIPVFPGESVDIMNDAGDYYIISDTAGQTVYIVEQE